MGLRHLLVLIAVVLFAWAALIAATWVDVGNWHVLVPAGLALWAVADLPWVDRRLP